MVSLSKGTKLERYVIARVLGEGGFGITYLAEDETLGKKFAIKEYFPQSWVNRDPSDSVSVSINSASTGDYGWGLKRFIEEARTLAKFRHPNIVNVNSIIEANNTAYMVLDYADGEDLGKWLKRLNRMPAQADLDNILEPLIDALSLVHSNNILHRDIAPDNIYIREDGSPVLLDFGAARTALGQRTGTMTGIVKNGFSPIEQYSSTGKDQGPWTDIYALGATLYKVVTGTILPEAAERMIDDNYVPVSDAAKGEYRKSFLAAIDHALGCRRQDRPQSLDEWKQELFATEGIGEGVGEGIGERKTTFAEPRAKLPGAATQTQSSEGGGALKWAAILALITLAGGGGYYMGVVRPAQDLKQLQAELTARTGNERAQKTRRAENERKQQARAIEKERAQAEEKRKLDNDAWDVAQRKNTILTYTAYLNAQPDGRYRNQARTKITALEEESSGDLFDRANRAYQNQDYGEALKWFRKSAEKGNAAAMTSLGLMYESAQGVGRDVREAVRWYWKAADKGDANGMTSLGVMYENGQGIERDLREAVRWYRRAADKGHLRAMSNLGVVYENGKGVGRDFKEAVRWYRKAADKGYANGMTSLGVMYENGKGIGKDPREAVRWYHKAADKGNPTALYGLALAHITGSGAAKDSKAAALYMFKSLSKNHDFAVTEMTTNANAWSQTFRR